MMSANRPIGVFDSGIGGSGIVKEIKKLMPKERVVFLADSKNCPYGDKSVSQIQKLSLNNCNILMKRHHAKLIVVACNTATVTSIKYLREHFDLPIIGVVPVVKTAAKLTKTNKVLVLTTPKTKNSAIYRKLIKQHCQGVRVYMAACKNLAKAIEDKKSKRELKKIIKNCINKYQKIDYDVLALGCTHYTLIINVIKSCIGEKVKIIDSNQAVARQVKRVLAGIGNLR